MIETLELITIESIELKQFRSSLYWLRVGTNDRDNCYVCGVRERREKEETLRDCRLVDSISAGSIITRNLTAIEVVDAAKIIKKHFDNINNKNERINAIANSRNKMLKIVIGVIFDKKVDD